MERICFLQLHMSEYVISSVGIAFASAPSSCPLSSSALSWVFHQSLL